MKTNLNPVASTTLPEMQHSLAIEAQSQASNEIAHTKQNQFNYGRCSRCSCPGFVGSGYTCTRGGCGHHYDEHG